jgi:alpha-ribazole phosphatase
MSHINRIFGVFWFLIFGNFLVFGFWDFQYVTCLSGSGGNLSRLLLVRHGETELNSSQRYWGSTDVALGAVGLRQAEMLRDRLASEKINYVYSSSMKRAMTTAEVICTGHHLPVSACPELKEINFGRIEGLDFNQVQEQYPDIASKWIQRSPYLAYPEGESLTQLDRRVAEFIARLEKHAAADIVLVVAHSGVLRTLICQLMALPMTHRWSIRLDLASLSIVETYAEGAILSLLNETAHLMEKQK